MAAPTKGAPAGFPKGGRLSDSTGRSVAAAAFSSELVPGLSVGTWYAGTDTVFHERVLLYPASKGHWLVRSPDGDEWEEDVDCHTGDQCSHAFLCSPGGRGPAFAKGVFYRFRSYPDEAGWKAMLKQGRADALDLVKEQKAPAPEEPEKVVNAVGEVVPFDVFFGMRRRPQLPTAKGGSAPTKDKPTKKKSDVDEESDLEGAKEVDVKTLADEDPAFVWLALEGRGGVAKGDEVKLLKVDQCVGDRGLHQCDDGTVVAVRRLDAAAAPAARDAAKLGDDDDARILVPLKYDTRGRRWQSHSEGVSRMHKESVVDFPLEGERTCLWLYTYVEAHGGTFESRQSKWGMEQKVPTDTLAYVLHDLVGHGLELALCYDQLDPCNTACLELFARLYMLIEETKGTLTIEGWEHIIGRPGSSSLRKGVALAPGLIKHALEEQTKETEILKQRRKAREETAASAALKKKGGPAALQS
jgi:hypothetical protein